VIAHDCAEKSDLHYNRHCRLRQTDLREPHWPD
jgi:hypothetical protein